MQLNEDSEFYIVPRFFGNYDNNFYWQSISWLGFQLEYNKRRFAKAKK